MPDLDKEELRRQARENMDLLTSDAFLNQLQAVIDAPEEERLDEAAKRLTPKALREAGVDLPEGVKISSRYFEPSLDNPVELGDYGEGENIIPLLEEMSPGVLRNLRDYDPSLIEDLAPDPPDSETDPADSELGELGEIGPLAACGGLGVAGVCACFGD